MRLKKKKLCVIIAILATGSQLAHANEIGEDNNKKIKKVEKIVVMGKQVDSGGLGARTILNTPFSVEAVDEKQIEERQAMGIDEILNGIAGVRTAANGISAVIPEVTVRGLKLDQYNGYKVDGLPFANRTTLPVEHFSQVELIKGLAGFQYGFGSPGGIVNYVSKKAEIENELSINLGYSSDGVYKVSADASGFFGSEEQFSARFIAVHEEGDTYVDRGYLDRDSVSLDLRYDLNDAVTLHGNYLFQERQADGVIFAIFTPNNDIDFKLPEPINGSTGLAPSESWYWNESEFFTFGADIKISNNWKSKINYRSTTASTAWKEGNADIFNEEGDFTFLQFVGRQDHSFDNIQVLFLGEIKTGELSHNITFGASAQELEQLNGEFGQGHDWDVPEIGNIYNVIPLTGATNTPFTQSLTKAQVITQKAVFASDTITYGSFTFLAGLRWNEFVQEDFAGDGTITKDYKTSDIVPSFALNYKSSKDSTYYISYVESIEKGGQANIVHENYPETFDALKSDQIEVGVKLQKEMWSMNTAVFQIERGSEYTNNFNVYVQNGLSRYEGIELGLSLFPLEGMTLRVEGAVLNAKFVEGESNVGNYLPGTPKEQASFTLEYEPTSIEGLMLRGSYSYIGDSKLQANNYTSVDSYATVDLFARYILETETPVTFTFGVKNLLNEDYWTVRNSGSPGIQAGAPRTISLGVSTSF